MKKIVMIATGLGLLGGIQAPVHAVATSITQGLAYAGVIVTAVGGTSQFLGKKGLADTVGTVIALGTGFAGAAATDALTQILMAHNACPAIIAANPGVLPVAVGAGLFGLMCWLSKLYLPAQVKDIEELGMKINGIGTALSVAACVSYLFNACSCEPIIYLKPIMYAIQSCTGC